MSTQGVCPAMEPDDSPCLLPTVPISSFSSSVHPLVPHRPSAISG